MRMLLAIALIAVCVSAEAANLFVRQGASGDGSGSDWTNACTGFSGNCATSALGNDTAYVADGSYTVGTISTASVTMKKCHADDGVSAVTAGYQSTYCDGQATIGGDIVIAASNVVLDGVSGDSVGNCQSINGALFGFRANSISTDTSTDADNVTLRYLNLGGNEGTTWPGSHNTALYIVSFGAHIHSGWTIERNYLHNESFSQNVHHSGSTWQYNCFRWGWNKESIRGSGQFKNHIIRWNYFYNACLHSGLEGEGCTADIAAWSDDTAGSYDGNEIYGNVFLNDVEGSDSLRSGGTIVIGGDGGTWVGASASNTKIYNNTIADAQSDIEQGWNMGNILVNGGTGNVCQNNLRYRINNTGLSCNTVSHNTDAGANPFVSFSSNLHLSGATTAGTTLAVPYDVDMDGVTRGSDGTWDRGAFEFDEGGGQEAVEVSNVVAIFSVLMAIGLLGAVYFAIPARALKWR